MSRSQLRPKNWSCPGSVSAKDEEQGGLGEGGEEDQHDLHAEDHNRAQEDVAEYPQRTKVQDGDLRGLRLETLNKKLLGKTNHSSLATGCTLSCIPKYLT